MLFKRRNEVERLKSIVRILIDRLPEKTLEEFVSAYLNRPYEKCPDYIEQMFLKLHKFQRINQNIYYVKETKKEPTLVQIGKIEDSLNTILENYILDKEGKGKLILSCPNCQTVFPLVCTTSENYSIDCSNCGKRLTLKVKSNEVIIHVNDNKGK